MTSAEIKTGEGYCKKDEEERNQNRVVYNKTKPDGGQNRQQSREAEAAKRSEYGTASSDARQIALAFFPFQHCVAAILSQKFA